VSALEILAAALMVLGTVIVFRVLLEADALDAQSLARPKSKAEEAPPLRRAA
jgi:hypothetical protein